MYCVAGENPYQRSVCLGTGGDRGSRAVDVAVQDGDGVPCADPPEGLLTSPQVSRVGETPV